MVYSEQLYSDLKHQASSHYHADLDEAINALRNMVLEQFESVGIRWTADIPLREAIGGIQRVCRRLYFERDTAREQVMQLKGKISELENVDHQQMKKSREQHSAMVQAIKVRADKERKQLDRKYKLRLKEDSEKIFEKVKAEYVMTNQKLSEKMTEHLKQVESAYIAACEAHQHKLADMLEQFRISYQSIADGFNYSKVEIRDLRERIVDQERLLAELKMEAERNQLRHMEHTVSTTNNSDVSNVIGKLVEKFQRQKQQIKLVFEIRQMECNKEHAAEIGMINCKVKDIIERKDRKISEMKNAIDTLHHQLDELTRMPGSD